MHPSLWLLTKLQFYSAGRRFVRSLKTVRGALLTLFGLGMVSLMILPSFFASGTMPTNWGLIDNYGPIVLFAYTLMLMFSSVGEQAISFSPSEIDFLFPAPFTRRQLLTYRLVNNVASTIFLTLVIGFTNRMQYANTFAGVVGIFLTFTFMNLLATFTGLVGQTVSARAFTRSRQVIGLVMIGFLAYAFSNAMMQWEGSSYRDIPKLAESTMAGRVVLAPFRVLCNAITAKQVFPDFLWPAGIALSMLGTLVAGIFWLDADFNETAIRVGQQKLDKLKKMQRGDFSGGAKGKSSGSTKVSMLPYWQGAGPIIWRQVVRAIRQSKTMFRIVGIMLVFASIPIYRNFVGKEPDPKLPLYAMGWLAYFTILFAGAAPVGFRADIDRMEVLKSLPTKPGAIVVGQVAGATLIVSLIHWITMLVIAILMPSGWYYCLAGALLCIPFNGLLMTVSNGLFLLLPFRAQNAAQDPSAVFKSMFLMIFQFLIYGVVGALTFAPAGLAYYLTESLSLAVLMAAVMLIIFTVAGLVLVRFAFNRFDVVRHAPTS